MSNRARDGAPSLANQVRSGARFIPLVMLVIFSVVIAVVGFVTARAQFSEDLKQSAPASLRPPTNGATSGLPAVCRQEIPAPPTEPWLSGGESRAAAEAIWAAHAEELATPYFREKDDWYDWGDVQAANISQAVGRENLSIVEAQSWNTYFSELEQDLSQLDIPLFVVITPAKWDVYPQQLPDWAQGIRGSNSLDQLLIRHPELPLIDLRAPLRRASSDHQTYSKLNSHWSDYGAWVGWSAITDCMRETSNVFEGLSAPVIDGVVVSADRNEFSSFGVADAAPNWTSPSYSETLADVSIRDTDGSSLVTGDVQTDLLKLPATTVTASAQTPLTALVARDSYGSALSVPMQQSFSTTWQVRHNLDGERDSQPDLAELAAEHRPSVVILQVTQRHLNFAPSP